MTDTYLTWQLIDSAFPGGGFAHSAGLEAAWQQGHVGSAAELEGFLVSGLQSAASALLPFLVAGHGTLEVGGADTDATFDAIDRQCDLLLNSHVANRASRAQGRAFLWSAAKIFPVKGLRNFADAARSRRGPGHFAPIFGVTCATLGVPVGEAARMYLFLSLRGMVSAAVRLGIVGPLEGQALQRTLSPRAAEWAERGLRVSLEEAAPTAPFLDLLQATHDRLYSRLFQS